MAEWSKALVWKTSRLCSTRVQIPSTPYYIYKRAVLSVSFSPFEASNILAFGWLYSQYIFVSEGLTVRGSLFRELYGPDIFFTEQFSAARASFNSSLSEIYAGIEQSLSSNFFFVSAAISIISMYPFTPRESISALLQSAHVFVHDSMLLPYVGRRGSRYLPLPPYAFIAILFGNLPGPIPGVLPITSQLNATFFSSSTAWLGILYVGPAGFGMSSFTNPFPHSVPFRSAPFLMYVEVVPYTVRLASLALRLFANIVAGHILLDTISLSGYYAAINVDMLSSIVTIIGSALVLCVPLVVTCSELLVAFPQAYISIIPAIIYSNESLSLHV